MSPNEKNQFVVDLGSVNLDEEQRSRITAAIHQAVAGQLATLNFKDQIVLVPVIKKPIGPILQGLIAREISFERVNELIQR